MKELFSHRMHFAFYSIRFHSLGGPIMMRKSFSLLPFLWQQIWFSFFQIIKTLKMCWLQSTQAIRAHFSYRMRFFAAFLPFESILNIKRKFEEEKNETSTIEMNFPRINGTPLPSVLSANHKCSACS